MEETVIVKMRLNSLLLLLLLLFALWVYFSTCSYSGVDTNNRKDCELQDCYIVLLSAFCHDGK